MTDQIIVDDSNFLADAIVDEGNETVTVPEVKTETVETVVPPVETKTDTVVETKVETPVVEVKISDPPAKFDDESDLAFNIRQQIWAAGQAKAQATTEEEKSELTNHIKGLRKELGKASHITKIETTPSPNDVPDDTEAEAKEALKKLGYVPKDEIEAIINEKIQSQTAEVRQSEQLDAAKEFYQTRKDIASDPFAKDVFEKTIVERFNLTPQSSKQDILFAMQATAALLFPKVDTRSVKANEAATKRDLLGISSNTQSVPTVDKADEKTAQGLKEIGASMAEFGWS